MATTTKKKDTEFQTILLVCGLFSATLIAVDIFAAKWSLMEGWVIALAVIFHALTALAWVNVFKHWQDPNKDYWKKLVIAFAIIAIAVIMGHRAGWIENSQFMS